MKGTVGILNVGCGDTKLSFDPKNPAECIRAARIVTDMLRRGYALIVEIPGKDGAASTYQRVYSFKEDTFEYIIADLDPLVAAAEDQKDRTDEEVDAGASSPRPPQGGEEAPQGRRGGRRTRRVPAGSVRATAVAHTAGG